MKSRYGILCVDKNSGYTSSDTVRMIARRLGVKKVGHTGTLDKFAEGVLICLAGPFTRLASYLVEQDKEYDALIELGRETETLDPEGAETARGPVPLRSALEEVMPRFRGLIEQRPPLYSAVHIEGTRAYRRARRGEAVEMPVRSVSIETLEILSYDPPLLRLKIACSKGTYVRSLARDIAAAAGTVAYVRELRRTRVGAITRDQTISPDEIGPETPLIDGRLEIEAILGLKGVTIPSARRQDFLNGRTMSEETLRNECAGFRSEDQRLFCFDDEGAFLGVLVHGDAGYSYGMVNGGLRN